MSAIHPLRKLLYDLPAIKSFEVQRIGPLPTLTWASFDLTSTRRQMSCCLSRMTESDWLVVGIALSQMGNLPLIRLVVSDFKIDGRQWRLLLQRSPFLKELRLQNCDNADLSPIFSAVGAS